MSIDASKKTIAKLEDQIKKAKEDLREKGAKLIESSGLLGLDISEKDLKKELKALRDKLAKK